MSIANQLESKLMKLVFANTTFPAITTIYGSLHTADPGETGTGSPLASTPRISIEMANTPTSTVANSTTSDFLTSASGVISHIGLWDGSSTTTGNALWTGALATTKAVNVGDTIRISSGQLTITLS